MTRFRILLLCACSFATAVRAQDTSRAPLRDFVGTYALGPKATIELVAGNELYAILDEAKYLLRRVGSDAFLNGGGDTITFPRNASGRVTGYVERGVLHRKLRSTVRNASAALAFPRAARGPNTEPYHYRVPRNRGDGIPVADISTTDIDTATAERIIRSVLDGTYSNVHSILLFQRGKLVLEEYFYGYHADRTQQLRSATKSVVSVLAGIAIDRGAIAHADVPVVPLLPYASFANPDPRKAQITLARLLSMSSGLSCNDYDSKSPGNETTLYESPDWVKATLDLPMEADPGSVAHYCSGGVGVVGRTVERAVGMRLPDFAHVQLFSRLGIARSAWRWNYTLTNANREYSQIHLRPRDMLKIGMLFADRGLWHGQRVLSEAWVAASLAEHSRIDGTGYGYFWWRPWLNVETPSGPQRVTYSAAQGNGGQKIYLIPELDLIAVFTGSDYNSGGSPPNKIMARIVLPRLLEARRSR
jgi:CubicO group peptidase (beta-lactamase class C family)